MSYNKTNWTSTTPITTTNLNNMESGIKVNDTAIGTLEDLNTTEKSNLVGAINEINKKSAITAYFAGSQITANSKVLMNVDTSVSVGNNITIENNTIIINKAMKIKLSLDAALQATASSSEYSGKALIYKNEEHFMQSTEYKKSIPAYGVVYPSIASCILDCAAGDTFNVYCEATHSTNTLNSKYGKTYITIEEV